MQTDLVQRQPNSEQRRNQRLDAEDGSELIPPSFSPGYSASSIRNSRDQPTNEMASVIKRQVCELTAEEKQEIVDLFDEGYSESYIMRKASMSRYNIKQVLYAAGRRGRFIKRNTSVNDGAHASTTVQVCLLTVRSMLERSYWGSSIQRSQDVPEKEKETGKMRDPDNLTPEDKQEIVDLFDKGHTCCYIIQKTNVSGYYIRQLLSAAGRTFRERKQKRRPATTSPVQYAGQNDQHGTAKTLERKPAVGKKKAMPQQCPVCGNWYSSKKVLKVHHRVHTGEKPFWISASGSAGSARKVSSSQRTCTPIGWLIWGSRGKKRKALKRWLQSSFQKSQIV
ncbi:uncharacterized protein LOC129596915 isoform X2 [Paramacrobiotus metropolitanus]|uniref:uncharacterized protein LOC129596915 isoform X2 n=1 Tax=Paramacrobiotus metropolitanus TaxID=2943436 RepID=UPI002445A5A0|nr:uncharacterized protein LOC129596915 isoform X2 [Paramacrobiotus metropolitanus]